MLVWPAKDPDEVLEYAIDWSDRLGNDAISTATFSLTTAAGMAIDSSDHDNVHRSYVTLSGGIAGSKGKVLCQIVTVNGQTLQQTATILVKAR